MAKLSDNQAAAVAALTTLCETTGAQAVSSSQWKKHAGAEITVSAKSLVKAGAVKLIRALNRDNGKLSDLYAPV